MITSIRPLTCLGMSLLFSLSLLAQKPKKILGIAKEVHPVSYYEEQSSLWQKELKKSPANTEAWANYYRAERAKLQLEQPDLWSDGKNDFYAQLVPILVKAKPHIGETFDYQYIKGMNTPRAKAIRYFAEAYRIDPDRPEVYGWLLAVYVPEFESAKLKDLAPRMLQSNIYSNASLKWNYNALQSIDQNGIIITNGDTDSMQKWVLQYGAGIRTDVLVINKWILATEDEYRSKVLKLLGIQSPAKFQKDFKNITAYADYLAAEVLRGSNRPAYISGGTDLDYFKQFGLENKMYLVGNVIRYSAQPFDNTAAMRTNFEQKYYLDYLLQNFQTHPEDQMVKERMNLTYLPALMHLRNHYARTGQKVKYKQALVFINRIAEDSGRKDEVLSWFDRAD